MNETEMARNLAWQNSILAPGKFDKDLRRTNTVREIFNVGFDAAPTSRPGEWVAVEDRQPDSDDYYWAMVDIDGNLVPSKRRYLIEIDGTAYWICSDGRVVAWMPIPGYTAPTPETARRLLEQEVAAMFAQIEQLQSALAAAVREGEGMRELLSEVIVFETREFRFVQLLSGKWFFNPREDTDDYCEDNKQYDTPLEAFQALTADEKGDDRGEAKGGNDD